MQYLETRLRQKHGTPSTSSKVPHIILYNNSCREFVVLVIWTPLQQDTGSVLLRTYSLTIPCTIAFKT